MLTELYIILVELGLFAFGATLIWFFVFRRLKKEAELSRDPFTAELARIPGHAASEKASALREKAYETLLGLIAGIAGFIGYLFGAYMKAPSQTVLTGMLTVTIIGAVIVVSIRLRKPLREARRWQLGADGERHTAQAIQSLAAYGCEFFHDLAFKDASGRVFNIDHVVLAPWGVLVIETKARRKAKDQKGPESAKVKFDGAALRFPGFYDTAALDQVRANTRFLAKKLLDRTGEKVTCVPLISLPGWYVETLTANSEVIVCNPLQLWKHLAHRGDPVLDAAQRRRIGGYLNELATVAEPST
ncbi:hypothetical protein BH09VER1_BH09VER1_54250 [soil metagenome]